MTETLLFVSVGTLFILGAATLAISIITLQHARRYVELAEVRMEHLREEHTRLLVFLHEERRSSKEEPEQEREQRLEPRQKPEGRERRARRDDERRIEQLKRELLGLREVRQENSSSHPEGSLEDVPGTRDLSGENTWPAQERASGRTLRPPSSPEALASEPEQGEDKRPRRAVWHPHPDDDVSPARALAGQTRALSDGPVKMFRRHYDTYLDNYEGYVKLAERIYRVRDKGEAPPGSPAEREWEERLRRVNDGIERTTARLDILEEYNPELATDDRISRRASIAQSHLELERSRRGGGTVPPASSRDEIHKV
jgi:hypothetical protein